MSPPNAIDPTRIAVLIPALNEELRIRDVVQAALAQCPNVIVIDDGSTDGTVEQLADLPIQLIRHASRQGKGEGLRDGFRAVVASGYLGVISMDGDGQHAASDIPRLLAAAARFPEHIVVGARLKKRAQQPAYRRLANEFGDWGIAWACGYRVADTQSGQRYYPAAVAALGDHSAADGFVFEADILIEASRRLGTRCVSIPIESRYQGADVVQHFRRSHFRPLSDLYRITSHVVGRVWTYGRVIPRYIEARRHPPVLFDPAEATAATSTAPALDPAR